MEALEKLQAVLMLLQIFLQSANAAIGWMAQSCERLCLVLAHNRPGLWLRSVRIAAVFGVPHKRLGHAMMAVLAKQLID